MDGCGGRRAPVDPASRTSCPQGMVEAWLSKFGILSDLIAYPKKQSAWIVFAIRKACACAEAVLMRCRHSCASNLIMSK